MGHTFAIEHSPAGKRGLIGGFIQSGFPLGFVFGSLVFALISHIVGKEAMLSYGWRLSFLTGIMPVILAIYIRRSLHEIPRIRRNQEGGRY